MAAGFLPKWPRIGRKTAPSSIQYSLPNPIKFRIKLRIKFDIEGA